MNLEDAEHPHKTFSNAVFWDFVIEKLQQQETANRIFVDCNFKCDDLLKIIYQQPPEVAVFIQPCTFFKYCKKKIRWIDALSISLWFYLWYKRNWRVYHFVCDLPSM